MAFRTSNPILREDNFREFVVDEGNTMTIKGTAEKTILLLLVVFLTASWIWYKSFEGININGYMISGLLGGLIIAMYTAFTRRVNGFVAILYAGLEGLVLGGVSSLFEMIYPGIVIQTVLLTLGISLGMMFIYRSGLIRVTDRFRNGLMGAMLGIVIFSLLSIVLSMFGVNLSFFRYGIIGIGISLFIVIVASLNLILDFDVISKGEAYGAPVQMEWYGAFGLIVTLIWLYLEVLRLLSILRRD